MGVRRLQTEKRHSAKMPVNGRPIHVHRAGASAKAIIAYQTGKRYSGHDRPFIRDLRERVLGSPEISERRFTLHERSAMHSAIASPMASSLRPTAQLIWTFQRPRGAISRRRSSRKPRRNQRRAGGDFDQLR